MSNINKNNYFNYIKNNNRLTPCQKKMVTGYYDVLGKIYEPRDSNKQVRMLISHIIENNMVSKIAKVKELFYAFFKDDFANSLIDKVEKENLSDKDFIDYVLDALKNEHVGSNRKQNKFCSSWSYILENITMIYRKLNRFPIHDIKYLDIGCGNGSKTNRMAKLLNIKKENVYGADITEWGPYDQTKEKHDFNFVKIENEEIPDLADNSIEYCSCILMLHHVEKQEKLLETIKRVLKPNGLLVVIEHNNYDDCDNLILDVLHMLFACIVDKNEKYLDEPLYAQYHNWVEWNYILFTHGFVQMETNPLFTELSNEIRYDNIFYSFYRNVK